MKMNDQNNLRNLFEEIHQKEKQTLLISKGSLGLIYETEKIGLSTGQELFRQREQLDKVEEKLDSVDCSLEVTQQHLTSMKSIFGRFKNFFSRNGGKESETNDSRRHNYKNQNVLRKEEKNQIKYKFDNKEQKIEHEFDRVNGDWLKPHQIDEELNQDLKEVGLVVVRLKQLSLDIGNEIDSQNSLINRISYKVEGHIKKIDYQNSQMEKILKQ